MYCESLLESVQELVGIDTVVFLRQELLIDIKWTVASLHNGAMKKKHFSTTFFSRKRNKKPSVWKGYVVYPMTDIIQHLRNERHNRNATRLFLYEPSQTVWNPNQDDWDYEDRELTWRQPAAPCVTKVSLACTTLVRMPISDSTSPAICVCPFSCAVRRNVCRH